MTREFWKAAGIRALHTLAQAALASIGSAVYLHEVNWLLILSASVLAAVISLLKSIAVGVPEVPADHVEDKDDVE